MTWGSSAWGDKPLGWVPSASAGSGTIALTALTDRRVYQRISGSATVAFAGIYTGTPTNIEARIVDATTLAQVVAWANVASFGVGVFSASIAIPAGGWYKVQARFTNDPGVSDQTTNKIGVGDIWSVAGQSQAQNWMDIGTGTAADTTVMYSGGSWTAVTGAGAITFANALASALSIPIALIDSGQTTTALQAAADTGFGYWLDLTASAPYDVWKTGVTAVGGKLGGVVWLQGENDSLSAFGISAASHASALATLWGRMRSHTAQSTLTVVTAPLGLVTQANRTDASVQAIRDGIVSAANADAYSVIGADVWDLPRADFVHYSAAGYTTLATRFARAAQGLTSRGPVVTSVVVVDSTHIDVNLTHTGGTDISPESGITGFLVLDGVTPATISAAVRQSASVVRLTLSAALVGAATVKLAYGKEPVITAPLVDDFGYPAQITTAAGVVTYTLSAASSALTLAGQDAALIAGRRLAADSAAFTLALQDAGLSHGYVMAAASGDYALDGQDATLTASRRLSAESASMTLAGQDAALTYSNEAPAPVAGAMVGNKSTRATRLQAGARSGRMQTSGRPAR